MSLVIFVRFFMNGIDPNPLLPDRYREDSLAEITQMCESLSLRHLENKEDASLLENLDVLEDHVARLEYYWSKLSPEGKKQYFKAAEKYLNKAYDLLKEKYAQKDKGPLFALIQKQVLLTKIFKQLYGISNDFTKGYRCQELERLCTQNFERIVKSSEFQDAARRRVNTGISFSGVGGSIIQVPVFQSARIAKGPDDTTHAYWGDFKPFKDLPKKVFEEPSSGPYTPPPYSPSPSPPLM